jgi:hypothetical protein
LKVHGRLAALCAAAFLIATIGGCAGARPSLPTSLSLPKASIPEPSVSYASAQEISLPSGNSVGSLLADFNTDGKLDIAVITGSDSICVMLNNGDGTFRPPVVTTMPASTGQGIPVSTIQGMVAGDFNEDGKADLLVSTAVNVFGSGVNLLLLSNGDGTFQLGPPFPNLQSFRSGTAIDLNGDHHLDLVQVINQRGLMVSLGNGDGTFSSTQEFDESTSLGAFLGLMVADFNADGIPDVLLGDGDISGPGELVLFEGTGTGAFQTPAVFTSNTVRYIRSITNGDLFGQGQDIIVAGFQSPLQEQDFMITGIGGGSTTFGGEGLPQPEFGPFVRIADLNGDGRPDLITSDGVTLTVVLNGEIGQSSPTSGVYQSPIPGNVVAIGDLNGDGLPDIVTTDGGNIAILFSQKP